MKSCGRAARAVILGPWLGPIMQNKANWEKFEVRGVKCKTKPISGGERLGADRTNKANSALRSNPGPIMQNKPNSGQPDRCPGGAIVRNKANSPIADCAKQTQLPEAGHRGGVPPGPGGTGPKGRGRGANAQNEPNLPGGAWGRGPWDVVRTKPIPAGGTERVSALWERSYGE